MQSEAAFNVTKATEAHWLKMFSGIEVAYAANKRKDLAKLEASIYVECVQRARATCAEKASTVL